MGIILGMSTEKVEYYGDYFKATGTCRASAGVARKCSEEEWEVRKKVLEYFWDDCEKVLEIFKQYHTTEHSSVDERAEFLRGKMLGAFPDLLTKRNRLCHVLFLMDNLPRLGYKLLEPSNQVWMSWGSWSQLTGYSDVDDMFHVWVHPDVEAFVESLREKGKTLCRDNLAGSDYQSRSEVEPNKSPSSNAFVCRTVKNKGNRAEPWHVIVLGLDDASLWEFCQLFYECIAEGATCIAVGPGFEVSRDKNDYIVAYSTHPEYSVGDAIPVHL